MRVGILGAASFVAGELIKLLLRHPNVELTYLESGTFAGKIISAAHPELNCLCSLVCEEYRQDNILNKCDLLFVCKSHTEAMGYVSRLQGSDIKIIDLSADFRLKDEGIYEKWYGHKHIFPQGLDQAVYGMPEIYGQKIKTASLIANPGCYPTSVILGIIPLVAAGVVKTEAIFADSYSGLSGAGKTPKAGFNLFIDAYSNVKPYKAGTHPHQPEIEQELQNYASDKVQVTFLPHIIPVSKGIISTVSLSVKQDLNDEKIAGIYNNFYQDKPFIRIHKAPHLPQLGDVVGTNFCDIGWFYDKRNGLIIVTSVIDNTLKGASGQAVQCMNLMCGWSECAGLPWGEVLAA